MFPIVNEFLMDSLRYLQHECKVDYRNIRISMPKRFIEAMEYYNRELYNGHGSTLFPAKYHNITVLENYKNEIAVFCVYYENHENELIKILNLQQ
ncbi:hypothetical protein GON26_01220 [Flavobacterium sp. GA093]|uniref:Uncharacterized protein n=1 Tax=Flavobacterium hydrocarbonoxydans TaxID=2683249 RepID=A0A6I4NEL2_9FLAO|nr:hypothetical protein [Flavobacterium hydrocarbonoxydans]MWB92970.1 hypothetical protein [Flavobacterium hydrocarbonoxydans]